VLISGNKVKISVRVYPSTNRNEVVGFKDGVLQVKVSAPPTKGKANRELVVLLSKLLEIGKGSVNIIKGDTIRNKVVAIDGLSREEVMKRLSSKLFSSGGASR
jgi:uncharacterized protein (TIGR00251 family)